MDFPPNHNRLWDAQQEHALRAAAHVYGNIQTIAHHMGRTCDSITSRMAKLLRLQYYTSNEELLRMFREKFPYNIENTTMNNSRYSHEEWTNAKFRLVMDGKSTDIANTPAEADERAKALVRANPTKDVILFKAVKKYRVPVTVVTERIK
jgi:hypothetical protein